MLRTVTLLPRAALTLAMPARENLSGAVMVGLRALGIFNFTTEDLAVVPRVRCVPFMPLSGLMPGILVDTTIPT